MSKDSNKPIYARKSLWANIIGVAAAVLSATGVISVIDPETQASIVAGIVAVGNIVAHSVRDKEENEGKR